MKVGILTFHHTTNYGATLQAYALWKIIKSQGHDVEIIDYRPYTAARHYRQKALPIKIRHGVNLKRYALKEITKYLKMRMFLINKTRLSRNKTYIRTDLKRKHYQHYDMVICGSDQVWCLNTAFRGFDPSYFLDFISGQNTCRKTSYAASFGSTVSLGENKELINQLLNEFDAISVRDSNSLELIQNECHRQATRVLDPTFLISYSEVLSEPNFRDYLVIYNTNILKSEEEDFVKSIARSKNLDIISIGKHNRVANKNIIGIGPTEWLGFFSKASYVVTNTYHGTIFSIIFKKQFNIFKDNVKLQKINDLLQQLGLEERILDLTQVGNLHTSILSNIDYKIVYEKLDKEVLKSKNYLFEILNSQPASVSSVAA